MAKAGKYFDLTLWRASNQLVEPPVHALERRYFFRSLLGEFNS